MQIENHKEEVPFAHYEQLFRGLNPQEAAERTGAKWDGKEFYVNLLGREFAISHPDYAIRALDEGKLPPLPTQTFLLRYLLESKDVAWRGDWKTFREMPWGEMYIKPYTGRVLTRAAFTFGTRLAAFQKGAQALGGVALKNGDAGYEFNFFGPFKMQLLLWEGDDEFPPSAQILYSDNFSSGFAAEDRVVAADILTDLVQEKQNPYADVFDPSRSILHPQLFLNAAETAVNLLTPTVPRCPHLGCALKYNSAEHTWDCPCHGSRFTEDGSLIDNPATADKKNEL